MVFIMSALKGNFSPLPNSGNSANPFQSLALPNQDLVQESTPNSSTSIITPENHNSTTNTILLVSKDIFEECHNLHVPKIKKVFRTDNLRVSYTPIIKYFLYGYQIISQWKSDKYAGLRLAVFTYNNKKSLENIDNVIKQLQLLKDEKSDLLKSQTLKRLANETAISKFQMLVTTSPEKIMVTLGGDNLTNVKVSNESVKVLITAYNQHKSRENFLNLCRGLFDWINTDDIQKKDHKFIELILYELSAVIEDKEIYELFNLLKSDKTHIAHQKIEGLFDALNVDGGRAIPRCTGDVLDIPQINIKSSHSKDLSFLKQAIHTFNEDKTSQNFLLVAAALKDWQHKHPDDFNKSNALEITSEMMEILEGVSKQDKIKKTDSYTILQSNKDKLAYNKAGKWNPFQWDFKCWKSLPLPKSQNFEILPSSKNNSKCMHELNHALNNFNHAKNITSPMTLVSSLMSINELLEAWIDKHPDEYSQYGGEAILKTIQINIQRSTVKSAVSILKADTSHDLKNVIINIKEYNQLPSVESLQKIKKALENWKEHQPDVEIENEIQYGEYSRYHGDATLKKIQDILLDKENPTNGKKNKSFPTLLLPNSHPKKVFDKSTDLGIKDIKGKSAQLIIFHNFGLWSHTDIAIDSSAESMNTSREYLGLARLSPDQSLAQAEGVKLIEPCLINRLEKLCKRRRNEIKQNMNVNAGASALARAALTGGYAIDLKTEEDKIRHLRQALIDNFLTSVDPKSFLPNFEEPRYRLEIYEKDGEIFRKWIEDPNGQFGKSNEDMAKPFLRNPFAQNEENGGLTKSQFLLYKEGYEKGNIVLKADGSKIWMVDYSDEGQYFKPVGTNAEDLSDVEAIRPCYTAKNCEDYLSNGESEWCGSYAVRMLHSAYAFEYMPEFQPLLNSLTEDFVRETSFDQNNSYAKFEKRHASSLFDLAEQYAKEMVASEAGKKYFRDMNPTVKMNPRSTPDQIHNFFVGKELGLLNSLSFGAKVIDLPNLEDIHVFTPIEVSGNLLEATLKVATYVFTATVHVFTTDLVKATHQGYRRKKVEINQQGEAGKKVKFKHARLFKAALFNGFIVDGLGRRVAMQYLGGQELINTGKKISKWVKIIWSI